MNTSIPQNIKRLRKQAGLTQEQMAEKLFVTRQTVSLWELGKSKPDIDTLQAIADCFQTDLMTVLYGASGEQKQREKLKSNLIRWGIVTGALWILFSAVLEISDYLRFHLDFHESLLFSYIFSWLSLWGFPLMAASCGGALAVLIGPAILKRRGPWWLILSLLCIILMAYYGWFWYVSPRQTNFWILTFLAFHLYKFPWAFLLMGFGSTVGIMGVRKSK